MVGEGVTVGRLGENDISDAKLYGRRNDRRHNPGGPFQDDVEPGALVALESQTPLPVQIGAARYRPSGSHGRHHFSDDVHGSPVPPSIV
jgi:hypothetical protein